MGRGPGRGLLRGALPARRAVLPAVRLPDDLLLSHGGGRAAAEPVYGSGSGPGRFLERWTRALVIGRGNPVKRLDRAVVGTKVGSRLLIVMPPSSGYGDQEQTGIPAHSTLVFVADVLAAT
ncbi:FKBP-type peptidyl-prolyl cis-trans isomerase [Streptomyces sp. NPDC005551]|uniref:FKBP-type peptidyl-prolyl cis-trans isomerase n=1 Tax=Streptomyces sp. NPDC005551 TaxID=3364725 RepID=UPI0036B6853C